MARNSSTDSNHFSLSPEAVEARQRLYQAIGEAICRWARVEGALCDTFWHATTASNSSSASAAFTAVLSFETQLAMVHSAVMQTFRNHNDVLEEWKCLRKIIHKLRPQRNKLAHGTVLMKTEIGSGKWRVHFLPFYFMSHPKSDEAFERLSLSDIERLSEQFSEVAHQVTVFSRMIWTGDWRPSKLREQEKKARQTHPDG